METATTRQLVLRIAAFVVCGLLNCWVGAQCPVPSPAYPTIRSAIDDGGCSEILMGEVVFQESPVIDRSVVLRGSSASTAVIEGRVQVGGAATVAELHDLTVDMAAPAVAGCGSEALVVDGGARVTTTNVVVRKADGQTCRVFADGFEPGDVSLWDRAVSGLR